MPEELPSTNVAGYIRGLIGEGVGPTEGLRIFRDEPFGHIQDSRWFQLYREVDATMAGEGSAIGLDPSSLPNPNDYGEFAAGAGGQYVTSVNLQMIDRQTGDWFTQSAEYWTTDPHTPEEAEDYLLANWSDPDLQAQYGVTVMGATAINLWRTTPLSP